MLINLKDYLKRKRTTLEDLIRLQKFVNYDELLEYCSRRKVSPVTLEDFNEARSSIALHSQADKVKLRKPESLVKTPEDEKSKKRKTTARRRRTKASRNSDTQKDKSERSVDTTIKDS